MYFTLAFISVWICFSHFVGDFVAQTRWMALGKGKKFKPLVAHICTYTSMLLLFTSVFLTFGLPQQYWVLYSVLNGILHLITDFFTSRMSNRAWANNQMDRFFLIIGFDQFIHMSTLFLTAIWIASLM